MKKAALLFIISLTLFACKKEKSCEQYNQGYLNIENHTAYNISYQCGGFYDFVSAGNTIQIPLTPGTHDFLAFITGGQGATQTWNATFTTVLCEEKSVKLE